MNHVLLANETKVNVSKRKVTIAKSLDLTIVNTIRPRLVIGVAL